MATEFVSFLAPPGPIVLTHPLNTSVAVPPEIPPAFTGAFYVRLSVFVDEQRCHLSGELDLDDPRSWHWVAYASVSGPRAPLPSDPSPPPARLPSEGRNLPISTVRLIPPPHSPHPIPGSVLDAADGGISGVGIDRATALHDGKEPYVKLGRLATLQRYRGLRLATLVVRTALEWAAKHQAEIVGGPADPVLREMEHIEGKHVGGDWRGLVMVHAQLRAVDFWRRMGFVEDEELGSWVEEGIEHVGMWRRLELRR